MRNDKKIITYSPKETIDLAAGLAGKLNGGDIIALIGGLGAGKTVFVKGIAKGLGVADHDYVNSPTFVIVKEYQGKKELYHFDVYRLEEQSFCDTMDYKKYFYGEGITVVEWADKIIDELPEDYLEVRIEHKGIEAREITLRPIGDKYRKFVEGLKW